MTQPRVDGLSHSELLENIAYDPETGVFTRMKSGFPNRVGSEICGKLARGYRVITIGRRTYFAHRVAWFYVIGEWPTEFIDHINQDKTDNRIANLRLTNKSENGQNRGPQANNKTGIKGVCFSNKSNKWIAQLCVGGKNVMVRKFDSPVDAANAYAAAAAKFHKCNPSARGNA